MRDTPERPERASSLIREPEATAFPVHPSAVSSCKASASTPRVAPGGEPDSIAHRTDVGMGYSGARAMLARFPGWRLAQLDNETLAVMGADPFGWREALSACADAFAAFVLHVHEPAVTALDSRLATAEQEAAKWKGLVFSPLGDNHHNAAACPYCSPTLEADRAATAERIRTAEASRARAEQVTTTLRALLGERHFLGSPLRGDGHADDIVMVPRDWYDRLKAALRPDETPRSGA